MRSRERTAPVITFSDTPASAAKSEAAEFLSMAAHPRRTPRKGSNLRSEFPLSLPVFGCCSRGTAECFRKVALVSETCLDRDSRNRFLAN
jgi:hypothetical protein